MKNWLTEHFHDPYPSHAEKVRLANEAGITLKQVPEDKILRNCN
jgi:hypothetical protein